MRLRHLLARSLAEQRVNFRCPRVHFYSACSCRRGSLPAEGIRYFPSAELWRELRHVHGWKPVNVKNRKLLFTRFPFKKKKCLHVFKYFKHFTKVEFLKITTEEKRLSRRPLPVITNLWLQYNHVKCVHHCTAPERRAPALLECWRQASIPLTSTHCTRWLRKTFTDVSTLVEPSPCGKQFRITQTKTNRVRNNFYPRAVASITPALPLVQTYPNIAEWGHTRHKGL